MYDYSIETNAEDNIWDIIENYGYYQGNKFTKNDTDKVSKAENVCHKLNEDWSN